MLPGAPSLWIIGALAAALPVTYGVTKIKAGMEVRAAYDKGVEAGKGSVSASTVAAATKTAEAGREAEAETPLLAGKAELIELCKRRASCRDRGKYK